MSEARVRASFEAAVPRLTALATRLGVNTEATLEATRSAFADMLPDLAYRDNPDHVMADSLFQTCFNLALYLAVREQGVGVAPFPREVDDEIVGRRAVCVE